MYIIVKMEHIILHFIGGRHSNMSRWVKIKIIIGAIVGIFAILVIILLINISSFVNGKYERTNISEEVISEKQAKSDKLNMNDDFVNIIYFTVKKNSDWSILPLSKKFRKKYNSKTGILNDNKITNISGGGDSDKEKQLVVLNIFHNAKKEHYYIHYTVNDKNELDDVEIVDKKLLYDENGNEVIYKETMDGAYVSNIMLLAAPGRLEYDPFDYIYVTDNYLNKWSDGFIDYDTSCGIDDVAGLEDKEQHLVYLYVIQDKFDENGNIIGNEWEKYFRVHYFVDSNMWLDDVEVKEISEEEINKLLSEASNSVAKK